MITLFIVRCAYGLSGAWFFGHVIGLSMRAMDFKPFESLHSCFLSSKDGI